MMTRTTITLSREALTKNINAINALTGHRSLALVVKSNAYGLGIDQIASLADRHQGVSWICTAGISEALPLRNKGITKPLLVLSYLDGDLEEAIRRGIHLSVRSIKEAQALAVAAEKARSHAYVHVKIDTGMGRTGLLPDEALPIIHEMTKLPRVTVYGIFTHLSDTGHDTLSYCQMQLERFDTLLDELKAADIAIRCTHAQSSSSLNFRPRRSYSFIRAGASVYGLWKSPRQKKLIHAIDPTFDLEPVAQWRARIIQLKQLPAGASVGYQRTFTTQRPTVLALVPVGYSDGYPYALSNKGVALIGGQQVPVVGIVSMNITAFDVTDIGAEIGDELILLGDGPGILPHEIAYAAGLITNQISTALHRSIKRRIVESHQSLYIGNKELASDLKLKAEY